MSEFFAMGGYGAFIWPAYGAAAILLAGVLILSWRGMHRRETLLDSLRAERRKGQEKMTEATS